MAHLTPASEQILKPTATIHVGSRLSLIERKVFNTIIWHSQKRRFTKNSDTLSVAFLMSVIGLERSKNMEVIKEALEKLTTTQIVWNTLKRDRTTDWGICTFLAGAELSGGKLRYVMNPLLVDKINHPTLFAKIQLLVQRQFSSKYSLALYEHLLDELGRAGNPDAYEFKVSLDTVRHILQFDGAYKHLHSDVLKPCVREINQYTDIAVGYRGVKQGRAVTALCFVIERQSVQIEMSLDNLELVDQEEDAPLSARKALALSLVERGVSVQKARKLVNTYDAERIRDNLTYAEQEYGSGKVKKFSAYVVRAIEEDYRPKRTAEELRKKAEAARQQERTAAAKQRDQLEQEWNLFRSQRVREQFYAFPEEQQARRRQVFAEYLKANDAVLYGLYRKEAFRSRLVEGQFFLMLRDELLTSPEETSIEAYQAAQA